MNLSEEIVSIVMPAYNAQFTIDRAICSVLAQTHTSWELLVINDSSEDDTAIKVKNFSKRDSRIKLLYNKGQRGPAHARNIGIELACGRYLAFLDADDWWESDKLTRQIRLMEETGMNVCASHYNRVVLGSSRASLVASPSTITYSMMLGGNYIGNLTGIYRWQTKVFQKPIGHEDYLMWLEILKTHGSCCTVQKSLANYTTSSESISANKLKAAMWHWQILKNNLNFPLGRRIFYFIKYILYGLSKRLYAQRVNLIEKV